ncbi:MAG TPA: hypothetical protein VD905_18425 [Flavobacteriales bacterium]|nr:hypothetical protein [Flavobacteriales bacterium]
MRSITILLGLSLLVISCNAAKENNPDEVCQCYDGAYEYMAKMSSAAESSPTEEAFQNVEKARDSLNACSLLKQKILNEAEGFEKKTEYRSKIKRCQLDAIKKYGGEMVP